MSSAHSKLSATVLLCPRSDIKVSLRITMLHSVRRPGLLHPLVPVDTEYYICNDPRTAARHVTIRHARTFSPTNDTWQDWRQLKVNLLTWRLINHNWSIEARIWWDSVPDLARRNDDFLGRESLAKSWTARRRSITRRSILPSPPTSFCLSIVGIRITWTNEPCTQGLFGLVNIRFSWQSIHAFHPVSPNVVTLESLSTQ